MHRKGPSSAVEHYFFCCLGKFKSDVKVTCCLAIFDLIRHKQSYTALFSHLNLQMSIFLASCCRSSKSELKKQKEEREREREMPLVDDIKFTPAQVQFGSRLGFNVDQWRVPPELKLQRGGWFETSIWNRLWTNPLGYEKDNLRPGLSTLRFLKYSFFI